jgi:hypothetical protein
MTLAELSYLISPEGRLAVEENLGRDPVSVALDKKLPNAAIVATQVKYLQRSRTKLPSYYKARCIVPPRAFEQSSGEAAAAMREYGGEVCIDLTCGLGVDALRFSKSFRRVIAIETDPVSAEVARVNFGLLGAQNITVINSSAEDYIAAFEGTADLIYADPDRRTGRAGDSRKVLLEDSAPDVVALMPRLAEISPRVVVKCSPLFDVEEAFRLFCPRVRVEVVSAGGECKEVLIECGKAVAADDICASVAGPGNFCLPRVEDMREVPSRFDPPYGAMIIPDVAFRKARLTARMAARTMPGAFVAAGDGYVFLKTAPRNSENISGDAENILGRVFEITAMVPYRPKALRRELSAREIVRAEIYLHNFPATVQTICRETGIREGGDDKIAFTTIEGNRWAVFIKDISLQKSEVERR